MASIVGNGIPGWKPAHESGKANFRATQEDAHMFGHQHPGIDAGVVSGRLIPRKLSEIPVIGNIVDNPK